MSADTAFEVGRLYAPIKAIADTLTAAQKDIFVRLPGIEGYYPMSALSGSGAATNHTGGGGPLVQTGTVPQAYDGNAYRHLGNGTNYFSATSLYGLTGTETYISSSIRGFTIGGWFMIDTINPNTGGLVGKQLSAPNLGYDLFCDSLGKFGFEMSGNGAANFSIRSVALAVSVWRFVVGRFIPSTEVAVFVDGDKSTNVTAIPALCNVSTQSFEIGRTLGNNLYIQHAKCRDVFICRSALSDELIEELRQSSMP